MLTNAKNCLADVVEAGHHEITRMREHCAHNQQRSVDCIGVAFGKGDLSLLIDREVKLYVVDRRPLGEHGKRRR